jgi:hypothetical protein
MTGFANAMAAVLLTAPLAVIVSIGAAFVTAPQPQRETPEWLSLAPPEMIPADGHPVRLEVRVPSYDAWTRFPDSTIAHVYARYDLSSRQIRILSGAHGRYHVPIEYDRQTHMYSSRCFKVRFNLDGVAIPDNTSATQTFEDLKAIPCRIANNVILVRLPADESFTAPL